MGKKWTLNFGNVFYLIYMLIKNDVPQTEFEVCISDTWEAAGYKKQFSQPYFSKILHCKKTCYPEIYDHIETFNKSLCEKVIPRNSVLRNEIMDHLFYLCENYTIVSPIIISELDAHKRCGNFEKFMKNIIALSKITPNKKEDFVKFGDVEELLLNVKRESQQLENNKATSNAHNVNNGNEVISLLFIPAPRNKSNCEKLVERKDKEDTIKEAITNGEKKIINIYGLTGNGKTAITAKIFNFLDSEQYQKIWFSGKNDVNQLSVNRIIDKILNCIGYKSPGQLTDEAREEIVEKCLLQKKFIFVLDDFERAHPHEAIKLFKWIFGKLAILPEGSKFIFTTQENMEIRDDIKVSLKDTYPAIKLSEILLPVLIKGMNEEQVYKLIESNLNAGITNENSEITILQNLYLQKKIYISDISKKLYKAANGNPYGIILALGEIEQMLLNDHSLEHIMNEKEIWDVADINERFEFIWNELLQKNMYGIEAKKIISCISLIPKGVSASRIGQILDIPGISESGKILDHGIFTKAFKRARGTRMFEDRDVDHISGYIKIYTKHGFASKYIEERCKAGDNTVVEVNKSIINWYLKKCECIGDCYNDIEKLKFLDEELVTIHEILRRLNENEEFELIQRFIKGIRYYLLVRCECTFETYSLHNLSYISARRLAEQDKKYLEYEFDELVFALNVYSKRGDIEQATRYLDCLTNSKFESCRSDLARLSKLNHATALYYYSRGQYNNAIEIWKSNEMLFSDIPAGEVNVCIRWTAKCFRKMGNIDNAKKYFIMAYDNAKLNSFKRSLIHSELSLIELELLECGNRTCNEKCKSEKIMVKRLQCIKDEVINAQDKKHEAKWNYLYSKSMYCTSKFEYHQDINKYVILALELYKNIGHKERQREISDWITLIG